MQLVSVIIPTFNRAGLLVRALESVAGQDYRPIEAIVVDDGSADDTPDVLARQKPALAGRGVELVCIRQSNGGAPKARNRAIADSRGALLAFLDSDDLWRPTFVSTLVRLFDEHPSAGLAFSGIEVIDPDDRPYKLRDMNLPEAIAGALLSRPFASIVRYMPLQTSAVMVRRSVMQEVGDFDLQLPVGEDWDLWYRIAKRHDFVYTSRPLACNREHPANMPKYSVAALTSGVRLNLRHLPDVTDPLTRDILQTRIARQILLLQEELLRTGERAHGYVEMLRNPLRPRSLRFRMGAVVRRLPRFVGRAYAGVIRWLGRKSRDQ